ncbi:MAG TPA: hypothetical protein VH482_13425 [Thermomicrobiales bacterium]|jgi:hypothetical protein
MDQYDGSRGAGQAPAKDFLALTHGQEWVNFYESFDKLVQDHLSRSSELLRRAMSLPEVADREVAQVRAEMEGKLAAERERSHDLLSKLRDEISTSHTRVTALANDVQNVAADLATLSSRVADALASLDRPATALAAESPAPMLEETVPAAPALNGAAEWSETAPEAWAAAEHVDDATSDAEPAVEAVAEAAPEADAEVAAEEPTVEPEPLVARWSVDTAEEADEIPARFDAETGVDLTALAEAESEKTAEEPADDQAEAPVTGTLEGDPVGVGADRPRPHWLSVTRIGSRP